MTDSIHRFIFDTYGIRGELVRLEKSSQRMLQAHQYPEFIADLLQQTAAVCVLLATTIKFEGKISIQLASDEKIKMLVVQTTNELGFRGLARFDEAADYSQMTFNQLVKGGQMCITIEPIKGNRYQGVVPLDGDSLAECVENYFNQSEQLQTRIWLYNDDQQVVGLMLQALPDMQSEEAFEHLVMLASTLTEHECLKLDNETLLHRLFHAENIKHLLADPVHFLCSCSKQKMLESISLLTDEELEDSLAENDSISVTCEFCLNQYSFNELDIKASKSLQGNSTQH